MPNTKAVGVAYSDPEFESVSVTGAITAPTITSTATTGAVALGNAVGFIRIYLNGAFVKIPVYGN